MPEEYLNITLMRHGRSRADDEQVHEGRYDSPLTDAGRGQVTRRAQGWSQAGVRFDWIVASTLARARESAEIVGGILGCPIELDADWMEIDNGPLAGLGWEEANTRYPPPAFHNAYQGMAGTGESELDVHLRAARAMQKVVRRGPGRYLVVAHGNVLNAAMRHIVGAPCPVNYVGIWFAFGDTGYYETIYTPAKHYWQLVKSVTT